MIVAIFVIVLIPGVFALIGWVSLNVAAGMSLAVVLVALAGLTWRRYQAIRASKKLEADLLGHATFHEQSQSPDAQLRLEDLRKSFSRAMREMRDSQLGGGGRQALYALPWYVMIGPPGVGKTTAIGRSGLKFPLRSAQVPIRGIGGTRNCDWWLANEAVLIDTAGRYTSEDGDREEWHEFLSLIKKHRRRRPLNGVLVAMSVEQIYQQDAVHIQEHAERIRAKIDEIQRQLGIIVPVFIIITKCDLIPGFAEVYSRLDSKQCEAPLGVHWEQGGGDQFELLQQHVEARCLAQLQDTPNLRARDRIHEYTRNFGSVLERVNSLITEAFATSVYEESPRLRGVYFTSALQEGSPLDLARGALAHAFGVSNQNVDTNVPQRQYFLRRLFRDRIFPEAGLVIQSARQHRKWSTRVKLMCWSVCGVGALSLAAICLFARGASATMFEAERALNEVTLLLSHQRLDRGLSLFSHLRPDSTDRTWLPAVLMRSYGLDPDDTLMTEVHESRMNAIRVFCVDPVVRELRDDLSEQPSRERLALYLLLVSANTPQYEWFPWLVDRATKRAPNGCTMQDIGWYLSKRRAEPVRWTMGDQHLVKEIQQEIYRRELQEKPSLATLCTSLEQYDIQISTIVRDDTTLVSRGDVMIPGCFTRDGWKEVQRRLHAVGQRSRYELDWIAPSPKGETVWDALREQLEDVYLQEYVRSWGRFVGAVEVRPHAAVELPVILRGFERGPNPVERLLQQVAAHTQHNLTEGTSGIQQLLAGAENPAFEVVAESFTELLELSRTGEQDTSVLARHRELVVEASALVDQLAREPAAADEVASRLLELVEETKRLIRRLPTGSRAFAMRVLVTPLQRAYMLAGHTKGSWLQGNWCRDVVAPIEHNLRGRYPFAIDSELEVTSAGFQDVFAERGKLWTFYEQYLRTLLPETPGRGFRRSRKHGRKRLKSAVEPFYGAVRDIVDTWMPEGVESPAIKLELRFHPTPEVASTQLIIGEHTFEYHNGPEHWHPFEYKVGRVPARLMLRGKRFEQTIYGAGEWSFLRLLEQGNVVPSSEDDVIVVEFPVHGITGEQPRMSIRLLGGAGQVARRRKVGSSGKGFQGLLNHRAVRPPKGLTPGSSVCSENQEGEPDAR